MNDKKYVKPANLPNGAYDIGLGDMLDRLGFQKKPWCKTHPTKDIGKDKNGKYFKQCYDGYSTGEKCVIKYE